MIIECILDHIRKTNPNMTMEKLLKELSKNNSSALAIAFIATNSNDSD